MSSPEQVEELTETSGDPDEQNDQENESSEEEALSQTDSNECGDVNSSQDDDQVPGQGSSSQDEHLSEGNQEGDTQSTETSGEPEEHKDQDKDPCEEGTLSQTGDMDSQDNEQVSGPASSSQEEHTLEGNQEGDTQSAGSEVGESSTEQIEKLTETSGDPDEHNDQENDPCEEGTLSQTEVNKCGDVDSKGRSPASSSQEKHILSENSDSHQEGDTQSAGSEVGESSGLMRMSSTEPMEEVKFFLVDSVELNERIHQGWVEDRASCVRRIELLTQETQELQLEVDRTRARQAPTPCPCSLLCKRGRVVAKKNQKLKDKCKKLKGLSLETLKVKQVVEELLQELDDCENNRKKIEAWKSEKTRMFERIKAKETLRKKLEELEEEEDALIMMCERKSLARE